MIARMLLLAALVAGCSKDSPPPTPTPTPTMPPPSTTAPPGGAPAAPATGDACADIRRRFDAALATRTDACSTAAECGCYNPVGGPHLGCGGVTDTATVAKLAAIEREFHAKSCAWTHNCAAWACAPRCASGRCTP